MDEHKCDEIKRGNCKKYVNKDHPCFETTLDPETKKHIVNYCIAVTLINVKKTYQFKTRCKDDMVNSVN